MYTKKLHCQHHQSHRTGLGVANAAGFQPPQRAGSARNAVQGTGSGPPQRPRGLEANDPWASCESSAFAKLVMAVSASSLQIGTCPRWNSTQRSALQYGLLSGLLLGLNLYGKTALPENAHPTLPPAPSGDGRLAMEPCWFACVIMCGKLLQ